MLRLVKPTHTRNKEGRHMKRTDEIIFVLSLYNKLSDKYPNMDDSSLKEILKSSLKSAKTRGISISEDSIKKSLILLFDDERKKAIKLIKTSAIEEYKKEENKAKRAHSQPYSQKEDGEKLGKLIDIILSDDSVVSQLKSKREPEPDPCHSSIRSSFSGISPC